MEKQVHSMTSDHEAHRAELAAAKEQHKSAVEQHATQLATTESKLKSWHEEVLDVHRAESSKRHDDLVESHERSVEKLKAAHKVEMEKFDKMKAKAKDAQQRQRKSTLSFITGRVSTIDETISPSKGGKAAKPQLARQRSKTDSVLVKGSSDIGGGDGAGVAAEEEAAEKDGDSTDSGDEGVEEGVLEMDENAPVFRKKRSSLIAKKRGSTIDQAEAAAARFHSEEGSDFFEDDGIGESDSEEDEEEEGGDSGKTVVLEEAAQPRNAPLARRSSWVLAGHEAEAPSGDGGGGAAAAEEEPAATDAAEPAATPAVNASEESSEKSSKKAPWRKSRQELDNLIAAGAAEDEIIGTEVENQWTRGEL